MVHFLLKRPIAVTMTFIAILIIGVISLEIIPVSLMPDIAVPEITVQVSEDNTTAREMESSIVRPLRRQLMQVSHLSDITSEARNANALIHLRFDYGTDIDFAFIEVNEKIDRAMSSLPDDIDRPKVIKTNATDIPVFYLNLTNKNATDLYAIQSEQESMSVSQKFMELSQFASNVIRKRIEQLPEVAMVDMSGLVDPEIRIIPDGQRMNALGVTQSDLEDLINNNNLNLGNLLITNGQYEYNVRFSSTLKTIADIRSLYLKVNGRLVQLKDVADVEEKPETQTGKVVTKGRNAISFAIIKQADAKMSALKEDLNAMIEHLKKDYPQIDFSITRSQTRLLDYSISNLDQSLIFGAILSFLIMFFFLKDLKAPLLIAVTIPTSLIISMLFFYLLGISINIISLSGIILGVGMMIDNSIIVIDNINQNWDRLEREQKAIADPGLKKSRYHLLLEACTIGTNEVFRPMLSSVLTTCAVFIPMVFIKGITGALFYDQAMAITIGLLVSLAVSITLLPVYYLLFYKTQSNKHKKLDAFLQKLGSYDYEHLYSKGFVFILRHQKTVWLLVILLLVGSVFLFWDLKKSRLPEIEQTETVLKLDWNDHINLGENQKRSLVIVKLVAKWLDDYTGMLGQQQFVLQKNSGATSSEASLYLKVKHPENLEIVETTIRDFLLKKYPDCLFNFEEADNIFTLIFSDDQKPLVAQLKNETDISNDEVIHSLSQLLTKFRSAFPNQNLENLPLYTYTLLRVDPKASLLYKVDLDNLFSKIQAAFNSYSLLTISDNQNTESVILGDKKQTIDEIIRNLSIPNSDDQLIPLRDLVTETSGQDFKLITAGKDGDYYPVGFEIPSSKVDQTMQSVRQIVKSDPNYEVHFTGSIFDTRELMLQLFVILAVSIALLYFILASQFESLKLPFIVLMEVPIDFFGAFLALKLDGQGINLMSLIGVIVMSGIVINDSILKIDTMNQLRAKGYSLLRAMAEAGHRRLKPILMTSLTTILALVPFLFTSGLGSDLQRPLALSVIGGMTLGTLVSLWLVPLGYYYLAKREGER